MRTRHQKTLNQNYLWLPVLLLALLLAGNVRAQALPAHLPITITANSAELDDRSGTAIYQGDVEVNQGDFMLWADRITLYAPERRPQRLVAEGNPVRVDAPTPEGLPRSATAATIEYHFADQVLVLQGDAILQTPTETARSDRIRYDLTRDLIRADGREGQRVQITITPQND